VLKESSSGREEAGAETIWTPDTTEWGNYRCRVAALEGFEWTFGNTARYCRPPIGRRSREDIACAGPLKG
jgi:hypothetical protein